MAIYTATTLGGNWNVATTWTGGTTFPGLGDTALFNELSGPVTVTSGATCSELNLNSGTGYANIITFANTLTIAAGNITFSSKTALQGFAMVGPNGILWNQSPGNLTRTITSFTVPFNLPFSSTGNGGNIFTLVGNFTVSNFSNASVGVFNGSNVIINGNIPSGGTSAGTSSCIISGATSAWSGGTLNRVIINSSGTVTISGSVVCNTSIIWTAGTLVATGSTITFVGNLITLQTGQVLNNLIMTFGGATVVISNNLILTGNLQLPNGVPAFNGPGTISVGGNLTNANTSGGTCVIIMNGTGSITGIYGNAIQVNTSGIISTGTTCSVNTFTLTAGTLNLANELQLNGGTLTITSGITFTGSSNLRITASGANITTNSITWPNSVIMAHASNVTTTIIITDNLTITGSFISSSPQPSGVSLNGGPLVVNENLTVTKGFAGTTNITVLGSTATTWSGTGLLGCNLTINKTGNFTVFGTVAFGNGKTLLYTNVGGLFTITGSTVFLSDCTLTLGSTVWNNLSILPNGSAGNTGYTVVLSADLYINGTFSSGNVGTGAYGQAILNGGNLYVSGNLIAGQGNYNNISGTSKIILAGTGTISGVSYVCVNLDITGTYTAVNWGFSYSGSFGQDNKTLRVLGTLTHTGILTVGNCTLTMGSNSLNSITIPAESHSNGYYTITLTQNTILTGSLIANGTATYGNCAINGLYNLYIGGSLSIGTTYCYLIGTTTIILNGTGTWSGGAVGIGGYYIDVIIDSPSGAITVTNVVVGGGKRTLCTSAGTFTATGYFYVISTATLNAGSFIWNDIYVHQSSTLTLDSNATVRDLVIPAIAGSVNNHNINGNGRIFTIAAANATLGAVYSNNGQTFTVLTTITGATTITCSQSGAPAASGTLTKVSGTGDATITFSSSIADGIGRTINITRNLTHQNNYNLAGTAKLIMNGSGTWSNTSTGAICLDLELNSPSGTIVIGTNARFGNLKTLRYVSPTSLTTTGSTLTIAGSATLDLLNITWDNLTNNASSTITLLSDINFNNVTLNGTSVINGLFNLNIRGNFITPGNVTGTSVLRLTGTGNWSGTTPVIANNTIIDTSGTITLSNNITWGIAGRAFTVTSGTLDMVATTFTVTSGTTVTINPIATLNAGSSTLAVSGTASTIFNTNSKNFFNIRLPNGVAIVINSLLNATGTLSLLGSTTFSGTAGWTCGILTCSAPGAAIILQSGITYTTTTNVIMLGTNAARIVMRSNAPTATYAIWTLQNPASQSIVYVNAQGIDSNAGMSIYSFQGVILPTLRALNWYDGASQGTKAFTFVS